MKNRDVDGRGNVSGLLLYARTEEAVQPDQTYSMSGNRIGVRTLDLNRDFQEIAKQLNEIAYSHFPRLEARAGANP